MILLSEKFHHHPSVHSMMIAECAVLTLVVRLILQKTACTLDRYEAAVVLRHAPLDAVGNILDGNQVTVLCPQDRRQRCCLLDADSRSPMAAGQSLKTASGNRGRNDHTVHCTRQRHGSCDSTWDGVGWLSVDALDAFPDCHRLRLSQPQRLSRLAKAVKRQPR